MKHFQQAILAALMSAVLLFGSFLPGFAAEAPETTVFTQPLYQGAPVPDFSMELYDGSVFSLSEALETHKAVLINIWGTWCKPCVGEMPILNEIYEQYEDDVAMVCISDKDSPEDIKAFMEENGLALPAGSDTVGIAAAFVQEGYPTNILIDRFGTYVYYEFGAFIKAKELTDVLDQYIGDDYTESRIYDNSASLFRGINAVSDEELSAAICPDGSLTFTTPSMKEDPYSWAFLPVETYLSIISDGTYENNNSDEENEVDLSGVISSNAQIPSTYAVVNTAFEASSGDVFTFDYLSENDAFYEGLKVYINGEAVRLITGVTEGRYFYEIPEDGAYEVSLVFELDEYGSYYDDCIVLRNASLLTGEDAEAFLSALPQLPHSLKGSEISVELLLDELQEIVFNFEGFTLEDAFGPGAKAFLAPAESVKVRVCIGEDIDPYAAFTYGDYEGLLHMLADCEYDEKGYLFECPLSSVEAGAYNNTYIGAFSDALNQDVGIMYMVFVNEQNVNHFCYEDEVSPAGWHYADGTLPSTDEVAVFNQTDDSGLASYLIYLVDENGDPITESCMVNVCTDETCNPGFTEDGVYSFEAEPYPYSIHVLTVPEGYVFDTSQEFVLEKNGDLLVITIPHAES